MESLETSTKKYIHLLLGVLFITSNPLFFRQVSSWKTKMLKLTLVMATILLNVVASQPVAPKVWGKDTGTPAYLSVPQFKDCLGHKSVNGGASLWCKLDKKPEKCPMDSWKQLHEAGVDKENAFKGSNCVN